MHGRVASLALAALLLLPAASAAAAVPPGNLLADPGAEAGPGAPDDATIDPPPGWTAIGSVTAVRYGASGGFPTAADAAALGGGANFFAGGPDSAASAATQTIDVSAAAVEIDAGGVSATVSGDFGGFGGQSDGATLTATFLDAAGAALGSVTSPAVTDADRNGATALLSRTASGAVPAGTRGIGVRLDLVRVDGAYNDGYADNLGLTLSTGPAPVFHKTVVAGRVSGTIRFRKPGAKTFVRLGAADQALPLGSTVDTTHGVMELSSAPRAGAPAQTSRFYAGRFKVTQPGRVTQLALTQKLASCHRASAAAAKKKKPRTRKLWGNGKGSFRVRGRYSAATVRGTKWVVQDSCAGTLTRVVRGVVRVRDSVRHKTIVLRAGKRYLARPKR
jgi:hypothetical protein